MELEGSFGNGSREGQGFVGVANHEVEPVLSVGLSVASPWIIRGNPANGSRAHSMGTGASLLTPFLTDPPDGLDIIAVQLSSRETWTDEVILSNMSELFPAYLAKWRSQ